jgi:hypothetical protein
VFENLDVDDSESPPIGLVPAGTGWSEVTDHVKIVHNPLLVGPDADGQYAGAYWHDSAMVVAEDLGSDQDEAIDEFRDILREQGHL